MSIRVKDNGDGTGSLKVGNTEVLRLTTAGVKQMQCPVFDAYLFSDLNISFDTLTKCVPNVKVLDTANCYDITTGRFTPNVAGLYQINIRMRCAGSTTTTSAVASLYKNGVHLARLAESNSSLTISGSMVVAMNGTTDYLELYGAVGGTGTARFDTSGNTGLFGPRFSGHLITAT